LTPGAFFSFFCAANIPARPFFDRTRADAVILSVLFEDDNGGFLSPLGTDLVSGKGGWAYALSMSIPKGHSLLGGGRFCASQRVSRLATDWSGLADGKGGPHPILGNEPDGVHAEAFFDRSMLKASLKNSILNVQL